MCSIEKPYFRINGFDIMKWVSSGGIRWSRNDVDGKNAGRTLSAKMYRDRIGIKFRADIVCIDMYRSDELELMNLILPEYVTVETNLHPLKAAIVAEFYSNNVPSTVSMVDTETGESLWTGITFPLIER